MADLPAINTLLQVRVADDNSFSSRLEGTEGELLMVSAPVGAGDVEIPPDGLEMEVTWTGNRTRYKMAVQMAGYTKEWPPRWRLKTIGEPERDTRRRYVRGGGGGPVSIRKAASPPVATPVIGGRFPTPSRGGIAARSAGIAGRGASQGSAKGALVGWVIDISEAGARCRVRGVEEDLTPEDEVVVELALEGQTLEVDATVLAIRVADEPGELEVVVTYEPPERDAKVIRKHVLQWEIAQRARNRSGGSRALAS